MSTIIHDNYTPQPVGNPMNLNGSDASYALGLCDGYECDEQYPDEPEHQVIFESRAVAAAWLAAVTAALTPYIETGDRSARIPDPEGWTLS